MKKIKVTKDGLILGIGRYTEIPFEAIDLADYNMLFPDKAIEQSFECVESVKIGKEN